MTDLITPGESIAVLAVIIGALALIVCFAFAVSESEDYNGMIDECIRQNYTSYNAATHSCSCLRRENLSRATLSTPDAEFTTATTSRGCVRTQYSIALEMT